MGTYKINLTVDDEVVTKHLEYWNSQFSGYATTGDTLREEFPDGSATTYVVYKGEKTLSGMCREIEDDNVHRFIIARHSRYDQIIVGNGWSRIDTDVEDI